MFVIYLLEGQRKRKNSRRGVRSLSRPPFSAAAVRTLAFSRRQLRPAAWASVTRASSGGSKGASSVI